MSWKVVDAVASPAAVIAGTVATAACVSAMSPWLQWSIAVIVGGGTSGAVQATTVAVRGASTAATGGIGNPLISFVEMIASAILPFLAVVAPILAVILLAVVVFFLIRGYVRRRSRNAIAHQP